MINVLWLNVRTVPRREYGITRLEDIFQLKLQEICAYEAIITFVVSREVYPPHEYLEGFFQDDILQIVEVGEIHLIRWKFYFICSHFIQPQA
jgi:hypothetical protein